MNILQTITVPQESVNDQFLTVANIPFFNGDKVKKGEIVLEFETSKALVTIESDFDGFVYYYCKLEEEVPVNKVVVEIFDQRKDEPLKVKLEEKTIKDISIVENVDYAAVYKPLFSEKAIKLIEQNRLNKNLFIAYDFVNSDVVETFLNPFKREDEQKKEQEKQKVASKNIITEIDDVSKEKISLSKKREIEFLSSVQQSTLISTVNINVDIKGIFESINPSLQYLKDSLLPIITFEGARLLKKYWKLNSFYANEFIYRFNSINIGIAVDIDDGLKVLCLRNTDHLSINEIEKKIFELSGKYLDKKLETKDLSNVTFTITDLSSFGVNSFVPLINKNNAGILGISAKDTTENKVILSLSFDHRVTEGKYVSMFLEDLKKRIESYSFLKKGDIKNLSKLICYKCMKHLTDDYNNTGFIKVVNSKGEEKLICDNCLLKF